MSQRERKKSIEDKKSIKAYTAAIERRARANWSSTPLYFNQNPPVLPQTDYVIIWTKDLDKELIEADPTGSTWRYLFLVKFSVFVPSTSYNKSPDEYVDVDEVRYRVSEKYVAKVRGIFESAQFDNVTQIGRIRIDDTHYRGWYGQHVNIPFHYYE